MIKNEVSREYAPSASYFGQKIDKQQVIFVEPGYYVNVHGQKV
jgi:hypothetical protein